MAPVITSNDMTERLPDGITMTSSDIQILQIPGLSKQARQIHISSKLKQPHYYNWESYVMMVAPSQQKSNKFQKKNWITNNKRHQEQANRNVKGSPGDKKNANDILDQTTKPELAQYLHAVLFSPTKASLIKAIRKGFLRIWQARTEKVIRKHIDKSTNTTMGHIHIIIKRLQSTRQRYPDTDIEDKRKTNEFSAPLLNQVPQWI